MSQSIRSRYPLLVACIWLLASSFALQTVFADEGISAERLKRVDEAVQRFVDEGRISGAVTMVAHRGEVVYESAIGHRGMNDDRPMPMDGLFRIYSMTKPITAAAAMQLYEAGHFRLRDPINRWIPEFEEMVVWDDETSGPKTLERPITMLQLLTHTAGLDYVFTPHPVSQLYRQRQVLGSTDLDEMIQKLAKIPLRYEPGTRWHYSVAVDVTGLLVQRMSGMPFNEYLKKNIFEPLQMNNTFFSVPDEKWDRLLPNHSWNGQDNVLVQHPIERSEPLRNVTFHSGGGGLVSTAHDYIRFSEAMRQGGALDGKRILGAKTVAYMIKDHLPATTQGGGSGELSGFFSESAFGFGLGFGVNNDSVRSRDLSSEGEYYWGGAAGTVFWIDPLEELSVVCMIQVMGSAIDLRQAVKTAVLQALTETAEAS